MAKTSAIAIVSRGTMSLIRGRFSSSLSGALIPYRTHPLSRAALVRYDSAEDLHSAACALTAASSQVRQGGHARSHRPCCYVIGGHAAKAPETAALRAFVLVPQLRIRCREAVGNQHFGQRYHLASPRRPFMGAASKHSRPQCWKGQAHQGGVWAGVGEKLRSPPVSNVLPLFRVAASKSVVRPLTENHVRQVSDMWVRNRKTREMVDASN